jgi:hypothetical protein
MASKDFTKSERKKKKGKDKQEKLEDKKAERRQKRQEIKNQKKKSRRRRARRCRPPDRRPVRLRRCLPVPPLAGSGSIVSAVRLIEFPCTSIAGAGVSRPTKTPTSIVEPTCKENSL